MSWCSRGRVHHAEHPQPPRHPVQVTETGFVLEVEEEWDAGGESWYCRETMRADVSDGAISEIAVYCTGDWDRALVARHAREVSLLRPLRFPL